MQSYDSGHTTFAWDFWKLTQPILGTVVNLLLSYDPEGANALFVYSMSPSHKIRKVCNNEHFVFV